MAVKRQINIYLQNMVQCRWYKDVKPENFFLTGGAIASLLQDEQPKDWDFYFKEYTNCNDFTNIVEMVANKSIKNVDDRYKESVGKNGKMITGKAITMNNNASFITMIVGSPEYVRSTFDYKHCMPYFDLQENKLYISEEQYDLCVSKKLRVNNELYVKEYREHKFLERGYQK